MTPQLLLEALRYLRERKFAVIPVKADKKPAIPWREYQNRLPTEQEVNAWFTRPDVEGIAVVTGQVSGIVVLDCEAKADLATLKTIPETPRAISGGGGTHFYFAYPTGKVVPARGRLYAEMDLQSDGRYIILPPSLHKSGNRYRWNEGQSVFDLPLAQMPDWLIADAQKPLPRLGEETLQKIVSGAEVGVAEGERHTMMTRWVGKLLTRFPQHEWDRFVQPLIRALNGRNSPPLPEREVEQIYESLRKKESAKVPDSGFKPIGIQELLSLVTSGGVSWVVDKLVPTGSVSILSGHPGSFKTFVLLHLALAVSRGDRVFGHFATRKCNVLIIDEENRQALVKDRFVLLGASASDSGVFISSLGNFKIDDRVSMDKLDAFVTQNEIRLVIFDSFVRVHSKDENVAREVAEVFENLKGLVKSGVAVVITHHHRKQAGVGKYGAAQSLRGSSDILAAVDTHLVVDYHKQDKTLTFSQSKMRVAEAIEPFDVGIEADETSISFTHLGDADKEQLKEDLAEEEIPRLLSTNPGLTRENIIAEMDGIGKTAIGKALRSLTDSGQIRVSMGAKGKKTYYLPEDEDMQD